MPPSLSLDSSLLRFFERALALSSLSSLYMIMWRTNVASTGLNGQLCGKPSSCWKLFHSPEGVSYQHVVGSERSRFTMRIRCGKCCEMMSMDFSLEISLNMFLRSREMRHIMEWFCFWLFLYLVMYLSISLVMIW